MLTTDQYVSIKTSIITVLLTASSITLATYNAVMGSVALTITVIAGIVILYIHHLRIKEKKLNIKERNLIIKDLERREREYEESKNKKGLYD